MGSVARKGKGRRAKRKGRKTATAGVQQESETAVHLSLLRVLQSHFNLQRIFAYGMIFSDERAHKVGDAVWNMFGRNVQKQKDFRHIQTQCDVYNRTTFHMFCIGT